MDKLYTFAVRRMSDPDDCDFYKCRVPDGENPLEWFEREIGEHAEVCYCSEPFVLRAEAERRLHKEDKNHE